MKLIRNYLIALLACVMVSPGHVSLSADVGWKWQSALVPDVGFDLDQARVIRVTSLASKGDGTLRAALAEKGPRIIVFEVGGVIDLDQTFLEATEPQVYLAGQTAPKPGVTLIRGGLRIAASQCVVQHLCVRPGDAGQGKGSGWQPDGITTTGGPVDVWIDHCSATWGCDENISAATYNSPTGQPARRIFIRDCIIAEGLAESTHAKGDHSKGTLVLDGTKEVAIVNNLYCSNSQRNPRFKPDTSGVVVNNVIVNPGQQVMMVGGDQTGAIPPRLSVAGNVVLLGPDSKKKAHVIFQGSAQAWLKDNEGRDMQGLPLAVTKDSFKSLPSPPVWPAGLDAASPAAARDHVAKFAGARPAQRDPIDQRIVSVAFDGSAKIINSQDDVGGYPKYTPTKRSLAVPEKGRAAWLERLAREVTLGTGLKN